MTTSEQDIYFLETNSSTVEEVARILAFEFGGKRKDVNGLEPGNAPFGNWPTKFDETGEVIGELYEIEIVDGELKGEPAFYYWRQFVPSAVRVLQFVLGRDTDDQTLDGSSR